MHGLTGGGGVRDPARRDVLDWSLIVIPVLALLIAVGFVLEMLS